MQQKSICYDLKLRCLDRQRSIYQTSNTYAFTNVAILSINYTIINWNGDYTATYKLYETVLGLHDKIERFYRT